MCQCRRNTCRSRDRTHDQLKTAIPTKRVHDLIGKLGTVIAELSLQPRVEARLIPSSRPCRRAVGCVFCT